MVFRPSLASVHSSEDVLRHPLANPASQLASNRRITAVGCGGTISTPTRIANSMPKEFPMLQKRFLLPLASLVILSGLCQAQSALLDLPRKSQNAQVNQTIGITDVTVKYSRPLVNGRKVWGGLVPYGDVWRAGANENNTITFSDPVTIEGKPLEKGTYGLFMLPKEDQWTIIFSRTATAWGASPS